MFDDGLYQVQVENEQELSSEVECVRGYQYDKKSDVFGMEAWSLWKSRIDLASL